MKVNVNCNKLAVDLESGFAWYLLMNGANPAGVELILRKPVCGLASTAIDLFAKQCHFPSNPVISVPTLEYLGEGFDHVVVRMDDDPTDPLYIDATASQFLGYAGCNFKDADSVLPEKVVTYRSNTWQEVPRLMAKYAFSHLIEKPVNGDSQSQNKSLLGGVGSEDELFEQFSPIWDPNLQQPFQPKEEVVCAASVISSFISRDCIRKQC